MHGGDIYRNQVEIDFSVNINPLGMPASVKEALENALSKCTCYPDIESEKLREALGIMHGVSPEEILCGNGASELFPAIVRAAGPKRIIIPVPSFLGYEKAVSQEGCEVIYYEMKEEDDFCLSEAFLERLTCDIDMLILANPNNPVGNCIRQDLMKKILVCCKKNQIKIVLDECFIDFTECADKKTMLPYAEEYPNMVIVRAFTKIFAIPGVRLGYLVCADPILIDKIKGQLPEWNLSIFAQEAGYAAVREKEFLERTVTETARERKFLKEELERLRIRVYEGSANFLMLYTGLPIAEALLKEKILIRDCSNFRGLTKGYYRIAVKTRKENRVLIEKIRQTADEKGRVEDGRIIVL